MNVIYQNRVEIANDFVSLIKCFDALGDSTRVQILALLLENPSAEMCVNEIAQSIYLSRPAISHHLKVLKDCDMINCCAKAQYNYYSINKNTPVWEELCKLFSKVNNLLELIQGRK